MPFNRDRPRESFTVTCGDCGNECQIPFKPRDSRPVYCKECFQKHKPQSGGSRFGGRSRYGGRSRDGPREMFTATCGDCGNECQIPFEPKNDKPVYCSECFKDHKPQRNESRFGGRSRYGGRSRDGPREMFTATCGDCGNECQIPFEPKNDKPVYCSECFKDHKPQRNESRFGGRSRYGGRSRDGPREMFTATCGDCGNECQIPFKPKGDRPVYCKECFEDHR